MIKGIQIGIFIFLIFLVLLLFGTFLITGRNIGREAITGFSVYNTENAFDCSNDDHTCDYSMKNCIDNYIFIDEGDTDYTTIIKNQGSYCEYTTRSVRSANPDFKSLSMKCKVPIEKTASLDGLDFLKYCEGSLKEEIYNQISGLTLRDFFTNAVIN